MLIRVASALSSLLAAATLAPGQWSVTAPASHQVHSNLTYLTVNGHESKLDVFRRRDAAGPHPTLIYIHGGGWTGGFKEDGLMYTLPWLESGWNVVNVEYRLARVAPAPGAVEDCLCALRWIAGHAKQYGIDVEKLVVMGDSAGGHLALTTGMIPASARLDSPCSPSGDAPLPKVAAIIDWYGITDVSDLLDGPNRRTYAVEWLSKVADKDGMAKRVSPLAYLREGLPPIIIIHGDADPTVPYSHSVRLKEALDLVHVPNQLITIPNGKHGGFPPAERVRAYHAIEEFLAKNGVWKGSIGHAPQ